MRKSSFSNQMRLTLLKGMEAIGTTASNLASNAKIKANEINLENRRREILTDFSLQAFEMWQKGVQLPESLSEMMQELSEIEDRLSVLRAQKFAKVDNAEAAKGEQTTEAQPAEAEEPAVECSIGEPEDANATPAECVVQDVPDAEPSAEIPVESDDAGSAEPFTLDTASDEAVADEPEATEKPAE